MSRPPGWFLVRISVKGWVYPRATVRLEILGQLTNSVTRDFPACSTAPLPTTLLRIPTLHTTRTIYYQPKIYSIRKVTLPYSQEPSTCPYPKLEESTLLPSTNHLEWNLILAHNLFVNKGRDSSVGIVYRMSGRGSILSRGKIFLFSVAARPTLIELLIQWISGTLSPWGKAAATWS
jgi:hypothetical protein